MGDFRDKLSDSVSNHGRKLNVVLEKGFSGCSRDRGIARQSLAHYHQLYRMSKCKQYDKLKPRISSQLHPCNIVPTNYRGYRQEGLSWSWIEYAFKTCQTLRNATPKIFVVVVAHGTLQLPTILSLVRCSKYHQMNSCNCLLLGMPQQYLCKHPKGALRPTGS